MITLHNKKYKLFVCSNLEWHLMKRKDRKKSGSHIQGLTGNRPNMFTADTLQEMEATSESMQLQSSQTDTYGNL